MKSNYSLCLFIIFVILSSSLQFSFAHDKTTLKRGKNLSHNKNEQTCSQIGKFCSENEFGGRRLPCCQNRVLCGGPCPCIKNKCTAPKK